LSPFSGRVSCDFNNLEAAIGAGREIQLEPARNWLIAAKLAGICAVNYDRTSNVNERAIADQEARQ
jgi:hypothetical protein